MTRSSLAHKISLTAIACWLALSVCAIAAYAQSANPVIGKWKMVSISPDSQEIPWMLTITGERGNYSAVTVTGSDTAGTAVKDLKIEGSKIHFITPYQGQDYVIDLKLDGDSLKGTWSGSSGDGETRGRRVSAP